MEPCPVSMHTGNGTFRALADRLRSLGWMDTIPLEGKRPLVSRRHGTARTEKGEWVGWTLVVRSPKAGFFDAKGRAVRPVEAR